MKTLNNPNNFYVAIVGPLGSGKTTLLQNLVKHFEAMHYPVTSILNTDHIVLDNATRHDTAAGLQRKILDNDADNIHKQMSGINPTEKMLIIADSSYHEHYIYNVVKNNTRKYKLKDYNKLRFVHETIIQTLPKPDMYIYVDVPRDQILDNIKARSRKFEVNEKDMLKYITMLKEKYHDLFLTNRNYKYNRKGMENIFKYTYQLKELQEIISFIQIHMQEMLATAGIKPGIEYNYKKHSLGSSSSSG